ncbi:4Fe-4S binding protein [Adlercreutzia sp. ZJ138]|uniref:4Fe-4S binding protein n=1 Tax=Adlercreutzia sp. ZJ138 TaxID=2709405 RepID=UPI0013EBB66B|nr:4Fe-4S binding protein [Adlercreutzia sp. ZJ138]
MKTTTLRVLVSLAVIVIIAIGYAVNVGIGTLSAIGWQDISLLCPLGALTTMLASKTIVPRAIISLVIAVVVILLLGRAFCGWVCPVPVVSKLRDAFKKSGGKGAGNSTVPLTETERAFLKGCRSKEGCSSCEDLRAQFDSRHIVLGGTLLSAAIFGFPVFCLICPIGLTFATVLLVMLLFGGGDVTWSIVIVSILLLIEVVLFRKWCSKICPLSALMSLVAKGNKTFKPTINDTKCLESSREATCGKCAEACEVRIDPRHPELGAPWNECTKCRACVDACPAGAISMPFLASKNEKAAEHAVSFIEQREERN